MSTENTWEVIDKACDEYMSQWSVEHRPPIEPLLHRVPRESRHEMARELVLVDIECSLGAGLKTSPSDYPTLPDAAVKEAFRRMAEEPDQPDSWILETLQACQALHGLRGECLYDLARMFQVHEFPPGTIMLKEGKVSVGLYVVLNGIAEIRTNDEDGELHVIDRSGAGAVLGEMSLLTLAPCTADVVAMENVRALVLPKKDYQTLCKRHEEFEVVLGMLVAERLGSRDWDALCGKKINAFRVERCLRRGGMGVVYEASHADYTGPVALKMLRHSLIHDEQAVQRFEQEGQLLKSLYHPNIVAVHDIFPAYRTVFLAMELCDGEDLSAIQAAHGAPIAEELTRRLLGQLAAGLNHAHQQRVVHLDLKPTNVLISRDGQAKLCDFGLAEILDADRSQSGALAGTPRYMSPEQLSLMGVGPECDWYGFGCLAYEMLTGKPLFEEAKLIELAARKANWQPPEVWNLPISDEMARLLTNSLRPLPEQRELDMRLIAEWAGPVPELTSHLSSSK